jgi:hypothetical protein
MYVAISILLVGVCGGILYIMTRPSETTGKLTATLTADPTTVNKGDSITLHWSSHNATELDLEPGVGKVQSEGSTSVIPQDSTTYTLTATGSSGTQTSTAHVDVTTPTVVTPLHNENNEIKPVKGRLSIEPTRVERGQSVMLRWSSQNATDLDLEPGVGKVQAEGSRYVTPQESGNYTLTATGPAGTQVYTAHVSVVNPPPPPPPPAPCSNKGVKGKITLGDFQLQRGAYDDAITEYQQGLKLDPSCPELQQKLEKAIQVCKKENAVLNEGFSCGGR